VSTAAQPVRDPYADYGGNVAAPEQDAAPKQADPYQAYGGSVAPPAKPVVPAPTSTVRMGAPTAMGTASAEPPHGAIPTLKAIGKGILQFGEDVLDPRVPPIEGKGSLAQKYLFEPSDVLAEKAEESWKQPGLANKVKGASYAVASAIPFAGPAAAQAGEQFGKKDIGGGLVSTGAALLAAKGMEPEAPKVATPVERAGAAAEVPKPADPYTSYGGATVEPTAPTGEHLPAIEVRPPLPGEAGLESPELTQATPQTVAPAAHVAAETVQRIGSNVAKMEGVIRPEDIKTAEDVPRHLALIQDVIEQNTDPRITKPLTLEMTRQLGRDLGMSDEDVLTLKPGEALNAERVMAARGLVEASRNSLVGAADAARNDPAQMPAFLEALARHQEIDSQVRGIVAKEAGRALGAFRGAGAPIDEAVRALGKMKPEAQAEAAARLAKLDPNDAGAISRFVRDIKPSSTADKIFEAWMNGLLSGGTPVIKAASDIALRTLGVVERPTAAAIDALRALGTGTPRERFFGEAPADIYGMVRGMPKALSQFWKTFAHESGMSEEVLDPRFQRIHAVKGAAGTIVRTPSRLLEAITDSARVVNYSAELHAEAYRAAAEEGLRGKALLERAEELAGNPTSAMREAAAQYALKRTFTQPLGRAGRTAMNLRDVMPGARYALPFMKIPTNILKSAAEYSPLGYARTLMPENAFWGERPEFADSAAKASIGTALGLTFLHAALNSEVTGSGAHLSPSDRERLEAKGWQPFSIKVGDRYYSYGRLEPLAPVLAMAADLAQAIKDKASGTGQMAKELAKGIAANLSELPFLSSTMRLSRLLENPGAYLRQMGGSVIPTGVADIAHILDPTIRAPKTLTQELESRIPGETEKVPALRAPALPPGTRNVYHVMGLPLMRPRSALGGFNPFPVNRALPELSESESEINAARRRRSVRMGRGM
jgi:hypothetical protein